MLDDLSVLSGTLIELFQTFLFSPRRVGVEVTIPDVCSHVDHGVHEPPDSLRIFK